VALMRLILVRHPQPLVAPGVCYGSTDLPVAADEQARILALLSASLARSAPLFSSPLQRCAGLAALLDCTSLTCDPRLAEMDFGAWEMRTWDHIPKAEIDAWAEDPIHYRPGGGESVLQMAARVAAFYEEVRRLPDEEAIVICHAGTIRLLSACHSGLPLPETALRAVQTPHKIAYGESVVLDV
jgi:alpha-ribazole phosphatase